MRRALATPRFLLLGAGFVVCGFHVACIAMHSPGVVVALQQPLSPAAGLVAKMFSTTCRATLFGVVMLTHQFGAYLGGKTFVATDICDWLGYADIVLAIGAA